MVSSVLSSAALLAAAVQEAAPIAAAAPPAPVVVPADTAWMLVSTALVLLMTPGVAFFYGGLVRAKNALNTMMMCMAAFGVCGIVWALLGYTLAFAPGGSFLGGLDFALLNGVGVEAHGSIPHALFMAYQASFAVVTATLIAGAIVDRMRFGPYLAFIALWTVFVYAPIAHWVWGGGWLSKLGVLDFAGGTVVHINAGIAATVAAIVVGRRKDFGRQAMLPHNVPFALLGAALLYFGWFGFNAGSALAANGSAAGAFATTMLAPMATLCVWMGLDAVRTKRATAVGAATAIVIGLVVITPAAGFVSPKSAIIMGALGALPSYYAIVWRSRTRLDDSLDVLAGHGVGGITGALLTGVFAEAAWGGTNGLLHGNPKQFVLQLTGVAATIVYSAVMSFVLLKVIGAATSLAADERAQGRGMDITQHGEEAYTHGEGAVLVLADAGAPPLSHSAPRGRPGWRCRMKLIVAIVRPDKLNDVLERLYRAEVCGLTVSRVLGHGGETDAVETYRGTTVKMELQEKVRLEIGVSESFVDVAVNAILESASTGEVGDGKIFVVPVENVWRIRTRERDEAAVTPALV